MTYDPLLAKTLTQYDAGIILNHMRGTPETWARLPGLTDPGTTVSADLQAAVHRARHSGMDMTRIVIDPGLGFGKRKEENSRLIADLPRLRALDLPIMAGPSRKSFIGYTLDLPADQRAEGTAAVAALCIQQGADLVRVHDVALISRVARMTDAVVRAAPRPA